MNTRSVTLLLFAVVAAVQVAVPLSMIIGRERTLREGQVFKFRTRPVDPCDAFRGRYVWLGLEPDNAKVAETGSWHYNEKGFAVLGLDTNGFAAVTQLVKTRPPRGAAVPVRARWFNEKSSEVHIEWIGLDRFYMEERQAPRAEAAYRAHNSRTNQTCHVTVRVRGTDAVVENLFVDGQPIRSWLRQHATEGVNLP